METIFKYRNRHMYTVADKRVVTLKDLATRLKNRDSFRVICHVTKRDISREITAELISRGLVARDQFERLVTNVLEGGIHESQ